MIYDRSTCTRASQVESKDPRQLDYNGIHGVNELVNVLF